MGVICHCSEVSCTRIGIINALFLEIVKSTISFSIKILVLTTSSDLNNLFQQSLPEAEVNDYLNGCLVSPDYPETGLALFVVHPGEWLPIL